MVIVHSVGFPILHRSHIHERMDVVSNESFHLILHYLIVHLVPNAKQKNQIEIHQMRGKEYIQQVFVQDPG